MAAPCAVYVHVPFCVKKCVYCDFVSYPGRQDRWQAYFEMLRKEIRSWTGRMAGRSVETVFFGGGTPSLPPAEYLADTLNEIRACFSLSEGAEITLEANPGTADAEKLRKLRRAGFNRISFGAQAMDDGLLRTLGRIHTAEQVGGIVEAARIAGFENLNLDLMYALPGQTTELWRDTLRQALLLHPEHISAYSLILEEGTPMAAMAEAGGPTKVIPAVSSA